MEKTIVGSFIAFDTLGMSAFTLMADSANEFAAITDLSTNTTIYEDGTLYGSITTAIADPISYAIVSTSHALLRDLGTQPKAFAIPLTEAKGDYILVARYFDAAT